MSTPGTSKGSPLYFATGAQFRAWLDVRHATATELFVGFHKKHTSKPSMTWPESVGEALCFGWVDGVIHPIDSGRYSRRFTPRLKGSIWSAVNIAVAARLETEGRMTDAGRAALNRRTAKRSVVYAYEQRGENTPAFDADTQRQFREHPAAWAFFETLPPSLKNKLIWWVQSAKKAQTKASRLAKLIAASGQHKRLG